jgi:glycosyltransferase involved in cell wall biosynthesis
MRVAAVIPAYDEESVVGGVVRGARSLVDEVLVVDDLSTDGTAGAAAAAGARLLRRGTNGGQGAALRDGLVEALRSGFDVAVTMDADGQHDPADIPALVEAVRTGADVAMGSRMLRTEGMPAARILANTMGNLVTFALYGTFVTDSQSGYRAYSRRAMERIRVRAERYEVCSWLVGEYRRRGLRIREVPVRTIYTGYSLSKGQSFATGLGTLGRLLLARLREWW